MKVYHSAVTISSGKKFTPTIDLEVKMNEIEILREEIVSRFPSVSAEFDKPLVPTGDWFLDVKLGDKYAVVDWSSKSPGIFGISDCSDLSTCLLFSGPDEVCTGSQELIEALSKILVSETASTT